MDPLVPAFTSNSLTVGDFLDFIGPLRTGHGGTFALLKTKCCWLTTCNKVVLEFVY